MRIAHAAIAALALSLATAPVVTYAHESDEHEEHEGWRGGEDQHDWGERQEERREEWREERQEDNAGPDYYYSQPGYGYSNGYGYGYGWPARRCSWVVRRYYDGDGDLVSHRARVCR